MKRDKNVYNCTGKINHPIPRDSLGQIISTEGHLENATVTNCNVVLTIVFILDTGNRPGVIVISYCNKLQLNTSYHM